MLTAGQRRIVDGHLKDSTISVNDLMELCSGWRSESTRNLQGGPALPQVQAASPVGVTGPDRARGDVRSPSVRSVPPLPEASAPPMEEPAGKQEPYRPDEPCGIMQALVQRVLPGGSKGARANLQRAPSQTPWSRPRRPAQHSPTP